MSPSLIQLMDFLGQEKVEITSFNIHWPTTKRPDPNYVSWQLPLGFVGEGNLVGFGLLGFGWMNWITFGVLEGKIGI